MSAEIVQAKYDDLTTIARRFARQAEVTAQVQRRVERAMNALQNGGWQGKGSAAFFGEMNGKVVPVMGRLNVALQVAQRTTLDIQRFVQQADEEASSPFRQKEAMGRLSNGTFGASAGATVGSDTTPSAIPPRIFIVNGINNDGRGLPEMAKYLTDRGYDPKNIRLTPSVYDSNLQKHVENLNGTHLSGTDLEGTDFKHWYGKPANWVTGGFSWLTNKVTGGAASDVNKTTDIGATVIKGGATAGDLAIGGGQVAIEYITGGSSQTDKMNTFIQNDLRSNPLLSTQKIILMGHSGVVQLLLTWHRSWKIK